MITFEIDFDQISFIISGKPLNLGQQHNKLILIKISLSSSYKRLYNVLQVATLKKQQQNCCLLRHYMYDYVLDTYILLDE